MITTLSNDDIAKTLDLMRPFYSECEMKILTAFMDKISALESKFKATEPDLKALSALDALLKSGNIPPTKQSDDTPCIKSTDYAYTVIYDRKRGTWVSAAHLNDEETVLTAEGFTEIDAFHNLMLKI